MLTINNNKETDNMKTKNEILKAYQELRNKENQRFNHLVEIVAKHLEAIDDDKEVNKRYFTKIAKETGLHLYYDNDKTHYRICFSYDRDDPKSKELRKEIHELQELGKEQHLDLEFQGLLLNMSLHKPFNGAPVYMKQVKIDLDRWKREIYEIVDADVMQAEIDKIQMLIKELENKYSYIMRDVMRVNFR